MAKPLKMQNNNDIKEHPKANSDMSRQMTANAEVGKSVTKPKATQQSPMTGVPIPKIPKEVLNKVKHEVYDAIAKIARDNSTKNTNKDASSIATKPDEIQELYAKAIHDHSGVRKTDDKLDGGASQQKHPGPTVCGMIDSLNVWLMQSYTYVRLTNHILVKERGRFQAELKSKQTILQKATECVTVMLETFNRIKEEIHQIRTQLDQGKAEIENAKEINKEYERLKAEKVKLHRAETEVGSLKKQLRDANVKGLQKRNQELETQLLKATAALNELKLPVDEPDNPNDSADLDLVAVVTPQPFPEAAVVLLRKLKASLDRLSVQVDGMKEKRGGTGWSIVERTAGMVTETKQTLTKEINDCLALRGKGNTRQKKTEMARDRGFGL